MKILQVILALSILIVVHEFGHFFFAKIFGIRVTKFFLFFDAGGTKLFSTKETKWITKLFPKLKEIDTEYGIGWLPLGGYCKIAGMIDESLDKEQLKKEPQEWEFRTKPAWQRLLVMAGGVLFNFILAIALYISIYSSYGKSYISNKDSKIYVNELAYEMGFRNGDKILKFDDYVPEDFQMLQADLVRREVRKAIVLRGNDTISLYIDGNLISEMLNSPGMFTPAIPFIVDKVMPTSLNKDAGLRHGDTITKFDDTEINFIQESQKFLANHKNEVVSATILRDADLKDADLKDADLRDADLKDAGGQIAKEMTTNSTIDTIVMNLQVDSTGLLGVTMQIPGLTQKEYSVIEAIPAGFKHTFATIGGYVKDLKLVFTPRTEAYKSVGSFIAIGQIFPESWNNYFFLNILALLSIMLGVMNLIPIPALDGGHIMFTLYEMITGKKPSDRFLEAMQIIGMLILLAIMFLAFGNDISRLIK